MYNVKQETEVVETETTDKTKTTRNVRDKPKDTPQPTQKTNENEVYFTVNFHV